MSKKRKKESKRDISGIALATTILNLIIAVIKLLSELLDQRLRRGGKPPLNEKNTRNVAHCQDRIKRKGGACDEYSVGRCADCIKSGNIAGTFENAKRVEIS